MAISISYFLDKKKVDASTPATIRCQLRYTLSALSWAADKRCGGAPIRYTFATADKCPPIAWENSACTRRHQSAATINRRLAEMVERAQRLHEDFVRHGHFPTPQQFAAQIVQGEYSQVTQNDFWLRYEQYIQFLVDSGASKPFLRNQVAAKETFQRFERAAKTSLDFSEIGRTTAAKFITWLSTQPRKVNRPDQDIEKTALYHIRALKQFINHALAEGWTTSMAHKQIKLSFRRKQAFPTTLTPEQIEALNRLDFSTSKSALERRYAITRDWFLFATQTALRFSDWDMERFQIIEVPGGKNLRFVQQKTINPLEIPLTDLALRIIERNGGALPPKMSSCSTWIHLAAICKMAGISERITSHTARRTFCTLQEKAGVSRQIIMRVSGHLTEKEYLKYLGISFEYNAQMFRRANPDMFAKASG